MSAVWPGREYELACAPSQWLGGSPVARRDRDRSDHAHRPGIRRCPEYSGCRSRSPRTAAGSPEPQRAFNQLLRGIHRIDEWANTLLKTTFKALCRVSLDHPSRIARFDAAACTAPTGARTDRVRRSRTAMGGYRERFIVSSERRVILASVPWGRSAL